MKKLTKIVLLLTVLALSVVGFSACKPSEDKIDSITVSKQPQVVYVAESELDLSKGELEIKKGKKTEKIDLDSTDVTVTGFDSSAIGEQVLTISYKGAETTLTVSVVPRVQVTGHKADYLVGDEMDKSKGNLKITRDDGSYYTVPLNNSTVTVSNFDSTQPAEAQLVGVRYQSGGTDYSGEFTVNIHEIENINFQRPSKINYRSHDEALSLNGSYLTLSGNNGNTTSVKAVDYDTMVSGFDLGAANSTNTPYTQTISVTYGEQTFTFPIIIEYTQISAFKDAAEALADVDLNAITADEGERALDAMELYFSLPEDDQDYIEKEEILAAARPAFLYGYNKWNADFVNFEKAFTVSGTSILITGETPEDVEKAITDLATTTRDIYTYGPAIYNIAALLGEEIVAGESKFNEYPVFRAEEYLGLMDMLQYMVDLHEKFEEIPADWTEANVVDHKQKIEAIFTFIVNSGYGNSSSNALYNPVNEWRANHDCFDILYAYYYYDFKNVTEDISNLQLLGDIALPNALNELFTTLMYAIDNLTALQNMQALDASEFFYSRGSINAMVEAINNSDSEVTQFLAAALPLNGLLGQATTESFIYFEDLIKSVEDGYLSLVGPLYGQSDAEALINKYVEFIDKLNNDTEFPESNDYGAAVEELFELYNKLTPTNQNVFLNALSPHFNTFRNAGLLSYQFEDYSDETLAPLYSLFVRSIKQHYQGKFTGNSAKAYVADLLVANEMLTEIYMSENGIANFQAAVAAFKTEYAKDFVGKADFTTIFGDLYNNLVDVSENWLKEDLQLSGSTATAIEEIMEAVFSLDFGYQVYYVNEPWSDMIISFYEKFEKLANTVMSGSDEDAIKAYRYAPLYSFERLLIEKFPEYETVITSTEFSHYSLERYLAIYRNVYLSILTNFYATETDPTNIFEAYNSGELKQFMASFSGIFHDFIFLNDEGVSEYDEQEVFAAINTLSSLSLADKMTFLIIESVAPVYYTSLKEFADGYFVDGEGKAFENAFNTFDQLLLVEKYYWIYLDSEEESDREMLDETYNSLKGWYAKIEGEEKTAFAPFEEIYENLIKNIEALDAEVEA